MDILALKWDNGDVKTPYNLTTNNAFAQPHEAKKGSEKQLNDLTPIPDKTNFLLLLKQSLAENRPFAYKRVPWGRNFYIHQDTVRVMVYILDKLDDGYRDDMLELVPLRITELAMKCWEIKENQIKFRNWFKYMKIPKRPCNQYEFDL